MIYNLYTKYFDDGIWRENNLQLHNEKELHDTVVYCMINGDKIIDICDKNYQTLYKFSAWLDNLETK